MTTPPAQPKIYHITHIDNLASIVAAGCIESDGRRFRLEQDQATIGMTEIKRRRLFEIDVSCHPDITYHGGQRPILHLQADMGSAIDWVDEQDTPWAFSDRNAGSYYTDFYNSLNELDKIDWDAVKETDFRDPLVKEGKQAEFLVHDTFPWHLVETIGAIDTAVQTRVSTILQHAVHKPVVNVERSWYY